MGVDDSSTIERIDAFCDAVPRRWARAEEHGPLVMFVPTGPGFPYYARPRRGTTERVTPDDIRAVRARQRELLIPESFEWIDEAAPTMTAAAPDGGLAARAHPLMMLRTLAPAPATEPDITVRLVSPGDPDLDRIWAVPAVAFGHPGTAVGLAGTIDRDKIAADHDESALDMPRDTGSGRRLPGCAVMGP
jgi:hypothetical protein